MALRKHAIECNDDEALDAPAAQPLPSVPSPALLLQQLLEQRSATLTPPQISPDQLRRLVMGLAAGGSALWLALIVSTNTAVSLIA